MINLAINGLAIQVLLVPLCFKCCKSAYIFLLLFRHIPGRDAIRRLLGGLVEVINARTLLHPAQCCNGRYECYSPLQKDSETQKNFVELYCRYDGDSKLRQK